MSAEFRCAASSVDREESLAGSASTVRRFLLVEAPGSWGVDAVRDNRLPTAVKSELTRAANRHSVRLLFIRRHGRRRTQSLAVFAAHASASRPWLEAGTVDAVGDLLEIDLEGLAAGRSAGMVQHPDPVFFVCTHGRHDVCCAERGRPIAAALHSALPQATWEVSHIGGDRFAGNVLVLPHGLYYGRLSPEAAVEMARRHTQGHLDLAHLRGRCGYPFPVQAAEVFLRNELSLTEIDTLTLRASRGDGAHTEADFTDGDRRWTVRVLTERTPATRLTCNSPDPGHGLGHRLVSVVTA